MAEPGSAAVPIVFGEALVDAFADALVPGGAPFNVACHLAALGLRPLLITRLGADDGGRLLEATAQRCGLSLRGAQRERHTARVEVRESAAGHVFEIPPAQAFDRIEAIPAVQATAGIGEPRWLYFGTLALRGETSRHALAALRASAPHRAFVDLNWREAGPPPALIMDLLHDIEVLKLSDAELLRVLDWLGLPAVRGVPQPGERQAAIGSLCTRLGVRQLLVSHGADGAAAWDAQGHCTARAAAPPLPRLVDTVGAGDAFSAMLLAGLLRGRAPTAMLGQAVAFASLSCGWRGALPEQRDLYIPWRQLLDIDPMPTSTPTPS